MPDPDAGVDMSGEDASAERPLTAPPGKAAVEEELHPLGAAEVEVVADHLLEELAAVQRAIEDLSAADLELENGELVAVPGSAVFVAQRAGQTGEPAAEVALDLGR